MADGARPSEPVAVVADPKDAQPAEKTQPPVETVPAKDSTVPAAAQAPASTPAEPAAPSTPIVVSSSADHKQCSTCKTDEPTKLAGKFVARYNKDFGLYANSQFLQPDGIGIQRFRAFTNKAANVHAHQLAAVMVKDKPAVCTLLAIYFRRTTEFAELKAGIGLPDQTVERVDLRDISSCVSESAVALEHAKPMFAKLDKQLLEEFNDYAQIESDKARDRDQKERDKYEAKQKRDKEKEKRKREKEKEKRKKQKQKEKDKEKENREQREQQDRDAQAEKDRRERQAKRDALELANKEEEAVRAAKRGSKVDERKRKQAEEKKHARRLQQLQEKHHAAMEFEYINATGDRTAALQKLFLEEDLDEKEDQIERLQQKLKDTKKQAKRAKLLALMRMQA